MDDVINAMFERRAVPGEYVIRQGDDGDNFYVIDSGVYDVIITTRQQTGSDDDDTTTTPVETSSRVLQFDGRGSFGELALMYNQPRAASVLAVTEVNTPFDQFFQSSSIKQYTRSPIKVILPGFSI